MQKGLAILRGKGYYIDNFHSRGFAPRENLKFKRVEIMNKSKFLKKSLAMLLALMLVFAMIPLSASAATYTDPGEIDLTAGSNAIDSAEPDENGDWTVVFNYTKDAPEVVLSSSKTGDEIEYVNANGQWADANDSANDGIYTITLRYDNGAPVAQKFRVVDANGNATKARTINWSVSDAESSIELSSAKLDGIDAEIDEDAATIHFTVPFGWTSGSSSISVTAAEGTVEGTIAIPTVDTNTTVGTESYVTVRAENGATKRYTITVAEPEGLTAFALGEYEGEFEIDPDTGKETGNIIVNLPAGTAKDEENKFEMVPEFTVGAYYFTLSINDASSNKDELTSGEAYDFAYALDEGNADRTVDLTLTDPNNSTTRTYHLKLVVDKSSTVISGVTVTDDQGFESEAAIDEDNNITAEVSTKANNVSTIEFKAPSGTKIYVGTSTAALTESITVPGTFTTASGTYALNTPIKVRVVSADGDYQDFYTLTVTKAESATKLPAITSAKLSYDLDGDGKNEVEIGGSIDDTTITFKELPYSTTSTNVTGATFTYALTSQTKIGTPSFGADVFEDENTVTVTSDNGDTVQYTLMFEKAAAKTGKTISNFKLTEADNVNLMPYYATYDVSAKDNGDGTGVFTITAPKSVLASAPNSGIYYTYDLDEGAKFYRIAGDKFYENASVVSAKTDGATEEGSINNGGFNNIFKHMIDNATAGIYVVVDEYLATEITSSTLWSTVQKTEDYEGHYTVYTVETNPTDRDQSQLTSISANGGLVYGTIKNQEITLNVPASYAQAENYNATTTKTFFFDFEVSEGASLYAGNSTSGTALISGGKRDWNDTDKKVEVMDASAQDGNLDFRVFKTGNSTELRVRSGDTTNNYYSTKVTELTVKAEDGTSTKYDVKINVLPAETGAQLETVTVNGKEATINHTAKTVTVALNYGTNLGNVELELTASKLADVQVGSANYTGAMDLSLVNPVKITVTAENGKDKNVYTLTATVGDMFSDVAEDQWYYDYVLEAAELGIVKGNPDGTFKPNDKVTRADFALMTVRMLGVDEDCLEFTTTAFTDVNDETYNAAAIQYCAEKGLIGGDGDGKFRPNDSITRQEAAKIIAEALELTETDDELFTDDNLIHEWAEDYVYQCKAAGIFGGDAGTGNFRPTDAISRAETAKIMVVAYNNK